MRQKRSLLKHGRFSKNARREKHNIPRALTIADYEVQLMRVYEGEPLDFPLARISKRFPRFQAKCDFCLRNNTHPIAISKTAIT